MIMDKGQHFAISRFNSLIFFDIKIWNKYKNKYERMNIAIDTGASVTTISTQIMEQLGYYTADKSDVIITASGMEKVYKQNVNILIGDIDLTDIDVYVYDFPDELYTKAILGMNVIEKFNFSIDFDNNLLELSYRERN